MKSETITINGIDLEVFYQVTEGMISSDKDVPDDKDELDIHEIKMNDSDISSIISDEVFKEVEKLLINKILN